jgi:DNA-binding transcriptional ArsR family regulator
MAKSNRSSIQFASQAVSAPRAVHLFQLLKTLAATPLTRDMLTKRLRRNVRAFYRDLSLLRDCGIVVQREDRRYRLAQNLDEALDLLPLPDPHLKIAEARELARGTGSGSRKIKELIDKISR